MLFRNPVAGLIHPVGWSRPSGNTDFKVTQRFGCTGVAQEPPLGSCAHFHRAIDLGNRACGAPVFAPAAGTVRFSGQDSWGANIVVIDHGGGWGTASCHLSSRLVARGATVSKGQKIGYVGSTGNSTACHNHFAVKSGLDWTRSFFSDSNGHWQDPWQHLEQNCDVRPKAGEVINLRTGPGAPRLAAPVYAMTTVAGRIVRKSDGADLGAVGVWHDWLGEFTGAIYSVAGVTGNAWDAFVLDGRTVYIARALDERSLS